MMESSDREIQLILCESLAEEFEIRDTYILLFCYVNYGWYQSELMPLQKVSHITMLKALGKT